MKDGDPSGAEPGTAVQARTVRCIGRNGYHRIAYRAWGARALEPPVICVHGLTRNSRDFDYLAGLLAPTRQVICPDLAGRGKSDWLRDSSDYHLLQYNMDVTTVAAHADASEYDWIGTSLGGLMGIALAGLSGSPIRRLIVNDIAPEVPFEALRRLTQYLGEEYRFPDVAAAERHLRKVLSPFAPMTDANWQRLAETSVVEDGSGFRLHHDPAISDNFRRYWLLFHFNLWRLWSQIRCPVLILRGTDSDFLTGTLLDRMCKTLPHAEVIEFEGVGHTPTLNAPVQVQPVLDWLHKTEPAPRA